MVVELTIVLVVLDSAIHIVGITTLQAGVVDRFPFDESDLVHDGQADELGCFFAAQCFLDVQ